MNEGHMKYLASAEWAQQLRTNLLPWIQSAGELGDDVLEIGPGPGLTTDLLRDMVQSVTAVELDEALAGSLADRMAGSNVKVHVGDAAHLDFETDRFSAATSFSMLHHVPTAEHQDQILNEICRVLSPGGTFFATDARDVEFLRSGHADDTFVPLPVETIAERFERAGFCDVKIELREYEFRLTARKPD